MAKKQKMSLSEKITKKENKVMKAVSLATVLLTLYIAIKEKLIPVIKGENEGGEGES
ncbi:MAG: hypothetical protein Q4B67_03360 [Eubacteriales bacterium]|nr:hypothetical protein [Eubacteriales bacterium]